MKAILCALGIVLLVRQQPTLTPRDVAEITNVAVYTATHTGLEKHWLTVPQPLLVDAGGVNEAFEKLSGRALPIDSANWLPGTARHFRKTFAVLDCPQQRRGPQCRMRESGTLVHIISVKPAPDGAFEMKLNFVHTKLGSTTGELDGFTAVLRVERMSGTWTARMLYVAVG